MFTEEKELKKDIFSKNAKSVQIVLNELNIIYPLEMNNSMAKKKRQRGGYLILTMITLKNFLILIMK